MLTTREAFEKFRQRLELSDTEAKEARRRHAEVRACIANGFAIKRDFLSGSYGRHTKTKPLKDVDIVFVLADAERERRKKPASEMLSAFEVCLVKEYGRDAVKLGRRCVTVDFDKSNYVEGTDGAVLSVDCIPAFEIGDCYEIPDRTSNTWIKTNPEVHADKATEKNKDCDKNWKPLVKMLKGWNRNAGKPIKPSFLVEVMALELVQAPFTDFPSEVRNFFAAAAREIGRTWPDPARLGPAVSDQMTPELIKVAEAALADAERKAALACRAEERGRQGEALAVWQDIFGTLFAKS